MRSSVDLPQPEGPMKAVTVLSRSSQVDALQRLEAVGVVEADVLDLDLDRLLRGLGRAAARRGADRGGVRRRVLHVHRHVLYYAGSSCAPASQRATMLRTRMVTVISSAPPQASFCQSS